MNDIIHGDCIEVMKGMSNDSVDAIVTDPPYGLSFMGKHWDYEVPSIEIWKECLRVLKPGGYLLSFAGTRTQHRMACNIEDAGFEIRDMIAWVYGSGFPKSLNIGKAIDKLQGNEREIIGKSRRHNSAEFGGEKYGEYKGGVPNETKGNSEWEGWGTALKPALEPITMARKPLSENTVVENCLKHGVGGINIDECRLATGEDLGREQKDGPMPPKYGFNNNKMGNKFQEGSPLGRFPANFIHDGSDEVVSGFPDTKGSKGGIRKAGSEFGQNSGWNDHKNVDTVRIGHNDSGSASRFFYCAKASSNERNDGVDDGNKHPTVKPIALMEYLVKLVSRTDAIVLDPFAGSGSTLVACKRLHRQYIGIEKEQEYVEIAKKRVDAEQDTLF